jgi:hypothetical protein
MDCAIEALYRIGRIDQEPDLLWIINAGSQMIQVLLPDLRFAGVTEFYVIPKCAEISIMCKTQSLKP